jgi:chitinase
VRGDAVVEADETFTVTLSAPSGATLGAAKTSTVTITNDDVPVSVAVPVVSISPVSTSVAEGNSGTTAVMLAVGLSQASVGTVTVGFATANGSAVAGLDYTAASGTVTFTAGQTSQQVSVSVAGDAVVEADETFTVTLSAPSGATLGTAVSTVTITNDDVSVAVPVVSISPVSVSVAEGNSRTKTVTLTVSLSQASGSTVLVRYSTANGSATAGVDYYAASDTVFFVAGQTSKQVSVTVRGDAVVEADETFTVTLLSPAGAVLGAGRTAVITITNDDNAPAAAAVPPTPLGATLVVSNGQRGVRPESAAQKSAA